MNVYIEKRRKNLYKANIFEHIIFIYIVFSILMFSFVNTLDATALHVIYVPYISGLVIYWHVFLTVGVIAVYLLFGFLSNKSIKIDSIAILLLFKCCVDLISYILNAEAQTDSYFGFFACSVTAFTAYLICLQLHNGYDFVKYCFVLLGSIVSLQTIATMLISNVSYLELSYKSIMNIPWGASNIIASLLVPCFFLTFFIRYSWKYIYAILITVAIIFTKSRGGVLLFVCSLVCYLFYLNYKSKNRTIKNMIMLICVGVVAIIALSNERVIMFFEGYTLGDGNTDFTSGRLKIFKEDFLASFHKPIFGHGLGVNNANATGSHNLFIDLLYKSGILGFVLYVGALLILFRQAVKQRKINSFCFIFVIIMLLNSMFEVCYFSYKCDTIFWIMAGTLSASVYNTQDIKEKK